MSSVQQNVMQGRLAESDCRAWQRIPRLQGDGLFSRYILSLSSSSRGWWFKALIDHGTEYCSKPETHDYQLYLTLNEIEHTKTKVRHPQTNGICERFHKTILQEFYQATFRRKMYHSRKMPKLATRMTLQ